MRGLYRKWLAASWRAPILTVALTLLPLWLVCGAAITFLPNTVAVTAWSMIASSVIGHVRPVRRLIRMRRYRKWYRDQHRVASHGRLCGCEECIGPCRSRP